MKFFKIKWNLSFILLLVYIVFSAIFSYLTSDVIGGKFIFNEPIFYAVLITTLCFIILLHTSILSRNYFIFALGSLFLFLFLLEISYFIYYGQVISDTVLDSIVETSSYEILSMSKQVLIIAGPAFFATFLILFIYF